MHGESGSLGENWDTELEELNLSQKDLRTVHVLVSWAQTVSLADLLVLQVRELDLASISWSSELNLLVTEVFNGEDLAWETTWCDSELISKSQSSLLDLSHGDNLTGILHLVQDWETKWSLWVSCLYWEIVEDIKEAWAIVPCASVTLLTDVVSVKSRDWKPGNL